MEAPKLAKEHFVADGEHEEHRKAAWAELFFDLAYVASGVKLGSNLKASHPQGDAQSRSRY